MHEVAIATGRTLEELEAQVSCREWTRWRAYHRLRPFGEEGADLRIGVLAAAFCNLWSRRRRVPMDYMPVIRNLERKRKARPRKVSPEDLKAKGMALLEALLGGKHARRQGRKTRS